MGVRLATYGQMKAAGFSGGKTICPKCGESTFVPFTDGRTGEFIDTSVFGRCERINECNYYFYPEDYFKNKRGQNGAKLNAAVPAVVPTIKSGFIDGAPCRIPFEYVTRSFVIIYSKNNFISYLLKLFDDETVENLINEYHLGESIKHKIIFWQIDEKNEVRTGKAIMYGKDGKRWKDSTLPVSWLHKQIFKEYNLQQCFFGAHLLLKYPEKPVIIFESEKTAIIAAVYAGVLFDGAICLAAGGVESLTPEKFDALKGRRVCLAPDSGALEKWKSKVEKLNLSDFQKVEFWDLEHEPAGADFADLIYTDETGKALIVSINLFRKTEIDANIPTINKNIANTINDTAIKPKNRKIEKAEKIEKIEKIEEKPEKAKEDESVIFERELAAARDLGFLNPTDFLIAFLGNVWKHRYHTLQGFQLFDGKYYRNIQERDFNRLKNVCAVLGVKVTNDTLKRLIYGENQITTEYNPLKNYFDKIIKEFDEKAARAAFDEFVTLTYERIDPEKTTFEHWRRVLRVWLAFSYAQIFDDVRVNDIALVFVSEKQGTGKTLIANALAAPAYELGLVSKPDFGDDIAKTARALSQNWILIDGELSRRRKADVSKFKDVLSEKTFSYVEKYERQQTTKRRIASFIFCGNDTEYLGETSRREAIIPFKEEIPGENDEKDENGFEKNDEKTAVCTIQLPDFRGFFRKLNSTKIKNGIWAYAFYVWENEEEFVSYEREKLSFRNTERSKDFLSTSVERQLLKDYFVPASPNAKHRISLPEDYDTMITPEDEFITYNLADIIHFLSKRVPSIRLDQRNMLNAVKNENFAKPKNCKINGVQKIGYRLRLTKV